MPQAHGYAPVFKFYIAKTANPTIMWTPAASARIILQQLVVSSPVSTTFRVAFGAPASTVVLDHWAQGSVMVYPLTDAWIDSLVMDSPLVISFGPGLSASAENTYVSAQGWEERP